MQFLCEFFRDDGALLFSLLVHVLRVRLFSAGASVRKSAWAGPGVLGRCNFPSLLLHWLVGLKGSGWCGQRCRIPSLKESCPTVSKPFCALTVSSGEALAVRRS